MPAELFSPASFRVMIRINSYSSTKMGGFVDNIFFFGVSSTKSVVFVDSTTFFPISSTKSVVFVDSALVSGLSERDRDGAMMCFLIKELYL